MLGGVLCNGGAGRLETMTVQRARKRTKQKGLVASRLLDARGAVMIRLLLQGIYQMAIIAGEGVQAKHLLLSF